MMTIGDRFNEGVPVFAYEPWSGAYRGGGRITARRSASTVAT